MAYWLSRPDVGRACPGCESGRIATGRVPSRSDVLGFCCALDFSVWLSAVPGVAAAGGGNIPLTTPTAEAKLFLATPVLTDQPPIAITTAAEAATSGQRRV